MTEGRPSHCKGSLLQSGCRSQTANTQKDTEMIWTVSPPVGYRSRTVEMNRPTSLWCCCCTSAPAPTPPSPPSDDASWNEACRGIKEARWALIVCSSTASLLHTAPWSHIIESLLVGFRCYYNIVWKAQCEHFSVCWSMWRWANSGSRNEKPIHLDFFQCTNGTL